MLLVACGFASNAIFISNIIAFGYAFGLNSHFERLVRPFVHCDSYCFGQLWAVAAVVHRPTFNFPAAYWVDNSSCLAYSNHFPNQATDFYGLFMFIHLDHSSLFSQSTPRHYYLVEGPLPQHRGYQSTSNFPFFRTIRRCFAPSQALVDSAGLCSLQ